MSRIPQIDSLFSLLTGLFMIQSPRSGIAPADASTAAVIQPPPWQAAQPTVGEQNITKKKRAGSVPQNQLKPTEEKNEKRTET
jgi:hypothetical protein